MKKALKITACLILLFWIVLFCLWKRGTLQAWAQNIAHHFYRTKLAPHLPFEIESIQVRGPWRERFRGKLDELSVTLKGSDIRFVFQGPLQITRDATKKEFSVQYSPQVHLQSLLIQTKNEGRSTLLPLQIQFSFAQNFSRLTTYSIQTRVAKFEWPQLGWMGDQIQLNTQWQENQPAQAHLQLNSVQWTSPLTSENTFHLTSLQFKLNTPLSLTKPSGLGPELKFQFTAQDAEILWDGTYLDVPLHLFPLEGSVQLDSSWKSELKIGKLPKKHILLSGHFVENTPPQAPLVHLEWKSTPLQLSEILKTVRDATRSSGSAFDSLSFYDKAPFLSGELQTEGKILFSPQDFNLNSKEQVIEAHVQFKNISLKYPSLPGAIKNLQLFLPISSVKKTRGHLSFEKAGYRRLLGQLGETGFQITPFLKKNGRSWQLNLGNQGKIPLRIQDVPLELGNIQGTFENSTFALKTSLEVNHTEFQKVQSPLCLETERIPPATVAVHFPQIEITPSSVDVTGDLHVHVFEGIVDIDEIGLFDLGTAVPELSFNLDFRAIQLERLGRWSGFGLMDGLLEGYAHDVTFQSWLPTHYNFSVDLKPFHHKDIEFSTEAMKNFVRIFAGEDIDHIPRIARWFAFGLPMKLKGGYDVKYAGLSLFSQEGIILIETHDPVEVLKKDPDQHYLLSGKNFKMPLRSTRYPLVVDATAMSNFVRQLALQFGNLDPTQNSDSQESMKEIKNETLSSCLTPDL